MSSGEPEVAATRSSSGPSVSLADSGRGPWTVRPEQRAQARDIVRLFQCRVCSFPLQDPVTLPCGRSLCRQCLPEGYERFNITYPADPERLQGIQCPFPECAKEHALGDCGSDVILNKSLQHLKDNVNQGKVLTISASQSNIASTTSNFSGPPIDGGNLLATWALVEQGKLDYDADSLSDQTESASEVQYADFELEVLHRVQDEARTEMDCQVCFALFCDPLTTACGHTFCRSCLQRILDHSRYCPVCRRKMAMNPLLNHVICPSNERLTRIIETFWSDELAARKEVLEADQLTQTGDFDIPLFVCTLSFPLMPTFLHIFEPRYRLMVRRVMDGDQTFGMVLPKRPAYPGAAHFHELGTLLRISNVHYYADGRSLIETTGVSRFRVLSHGTLDGYVVGKIDRIDDVSLEEEEALEALEAIPTLLAESASSSGRSERSSSSSTDRKRRRPETVEDVEQMSTEGLLSYASDFVERMRRQSVPWLTERMLTIYGECPSDPALFPWWLASMLPVREEEKYRLLATTSVRDRLKICCSWIVEWETSSWSLRNGCVIL